MKTKKQKFVIWLAFFALLSMYMYLPPIQTAQAVDAITDIKDTISDSDQSATGVTHVFTFTTGSSTPLNGYIRITMAEFSTIASGNVTCPATMVASTTGTTIDCVASGGLVAAGAKNITITGVTNPAAENSYIFYVYNSESSGLVREQATLRVAIISDVWMTATILANLTFIVSGVASGQTVNGVDCDQTTTATATPFGVLSTTASTTVCQQLQVATNADDGYIVTVEQDQELTSDSLSNINSFNNSPDGTGSTTPGAWAAPAGLLDNYNTYGHMGLTTNDADLSDMGAQYDFTGSQYVGLSGTSEQLVMSHTGPADLLTQNKGLARVAYTAEIMSLQEAGDYESTLTYICTPTY